MTGAKRKMVVMHPLPRVNEIRYAEYNTHTTKPNSSSGGSF